MTMATITELLIKGTFAFRFSDVSTGALGSIKFTGLLK